MVEVKGIVETYAVCKVANCGAGFLTTEDAWTHLKEHGLRAYYDVTLTLPVKKPESTPAPRMKPAKQIVEEAAAEVEEEDEPEMV